MFCMSENEKREQIGKLAEEYSELKGKQAHVQERLTRAQQAYAMVSNQNSFGSLKVQDGKLFTSGNSPQPAVVRPVEGLLSEEHLIALLEERKRLGIELAELAVRLKALAPHLL
jgi:hypothetical protein